MATRSKRRLRPRPRFNTTLIGADMALKGWNGRDLARRARVSDMTISRFFAGEQSPKTAGRIARALGQTIERYFVGCDEAIAS
jgi:transcriptional regulator with XRE-family HTH domain